jgi:chemotaxis protein CheD
VAVATPTLVGMAEIHVHQGPALYSCIGLGSCIGLVAHCPASGVSGMIHVMLPEAFKDKPIDKPGKFVDVGLPEMVKLMAAKGANPNRLVAAYAGGAQVFKIGADVSSRLDIGKRNAEAVKTLLEQLRIRTVAHDVGGSNGRTVTVDIASLTVKVRSINEGEKILCNLRG